MKVLIDADACPVVDLALSISSEFEIETILFCDTSHRVERDNVITIIVPKGPDSVDFTLVNALSKHDIVITQDYGLAAMVLARGGIRLIKMDEKCLMKTSNVCSICGMLVRKLEGQVDEQRDLKRTQENNISFEMKFRQICERAILAHKLEESTGEK